MTDEARLALARAFDRAAQYLIDYYAVKTIGQIVKMYDDQLTRMVYDTFKSKDAVDMRRSHKALLRDVAEQAFIEGANEGGLSQDEMDEEDQAYMTEAVSDWLATQLPHVNGFAADTAAAGKDEALRPAIIDRVSMWVDALRDFGTRGKAYAQNNIKGQWVLGQTNEHCEDCARYAAMKPKRLSWFLERKMPRSPDLACHGFNCDCDIVNPKTGKSLL